MKHLLTTIAALLVAVAAWSQSFNDSTMLTQQQWQHALAIVAQTTALNDGYGQPTAQFVERNPQGYTLDDLNAFYRGKRNWDNTYTSLKQRENDRGKVSAIKQLAGSLAGAVTAELQRYVEDGNMPPVAPAPDTTPAEPEAENVSIDTTGFETVVTTPQDQEQEQPSMFKDILNALHWVFTLVLCVSLLYLWSQFSKLRKNYADNVQSLNNSMEKFAEDVAAQIDNLKAGMRTPSTSYSSRPRPVQPQAPQAFSEPARPAAPQQRHAGEVKKTYYLSKPDENETFIRANTEFELGNSIFVLTTTDGLHGEYSVIENRDVHRFALMMPSENLTRACSGQAIQMANGMTRIVTDRAGEAYFENGHWHVSLKAIIHYE